MICLRQNSHFILFDNIDEFAAWFEPLKVNRTIDILQVHHTWEPSYDNFKGNNHFDMLESMRNSHIGRGFDDIAQNLTTFQDGKVAYSLFRSFDKAPAGIKGANARGVCVENIGNFNVGGDKLTDVQKHCIVRLYALMARKFHVPVDTDHVVYHHWYDLKTGERIPDDVVNKNAPEKIRGHETKTCPGTAFFGDSNTVIAAQRTFIPLVAAELKKLMKPSAPIEIVKAPEDVTEVNELKQWQQTMGEKAIDTLSKEGLLSNPDEWKQKLGETPPNWLFFEMLRRVAAK